MYVLEGRYLRLLTLKLLLLHLSELILIRKSDGVVQTARTAVLSTK